MKLLIYIIGFYFTSYLVNKFDAPENKQEENFVYKQFTFGILWPLIVVIFIGGFCYDIIKALFGRNKS